MLHYQARGPSAGQSTWLIPSAAAGRALRVHTHSGVDGAVPVSTGGSVESWIASAFLLMVILRDFPGAEARPCSCVLADKGSGQPVELYAGPRCHESGAEQHGGCEVTGATTHRHAVPRDFQRRVDGQGVYVRCRDASGDLLALSVHGLVAIRPGGLLARPRRRGFQRL